MSSNIGDMAWARIDKLDEKLEANIDGAARWLRRIDNDFAKQRAVNVALLDYLQYASVNVALLDYLQYASAGSSERLAAALREAIKP